MPEVAESETKLGAPGSSVAVQLSGSPPVLAMVKGSVLTPVVTLKVSDVGETARTGSASTFSVMATVCGLFTIEMPPSTAAIEMVPLYCPGASEDEATVTVKVVDPWLILTEPGETANQLPPVAIAVSVTLPLQVPVMPIVKVCAAGFVPASTLKVSADDEGACREHGGCTVSETAMLCGVPICCPLTLSVAVIVTVPLYVCAGNPARRTAILVVALELRRRLPVAGETASQALLVEAVHVSVFMHVPLALIRAFCAGGSGCPTTPVKLSAAGVTAIVQGGCTVKLTGIVCGLPLAVWPELSVPLRVIVPVYVPGVSPDCPATLTLIGADWFPESVPLLGTTVNHAPPMLVVALACQESVPPPVLETVSVCVDGLVCPATVLNDSAVGLADIRGVVACARMRLTNSVCVPAFELNMMVPV